MPKYTIVIENAGSNYSAYCPDLPGCIATGGTKQDTIHQMKKAIEFHLQGLKDGNVPIPETKCLVCEVDVAI